MDKIAHQVLNGDYGFLQRTLASAWLFAISPDKRILREAWAAIVTKYSLDAKDEIGLPLREGGETLKEEKVSSESVISTCPCYQNLEDDIQDEFVVYDEEEGSYIRYLSIDEKCRLCGNVVNSYGDVDWEATEEEYRLYLRARAGTIRKAGGG